MKKLKEKKQKQNENKKIQEYWGEKRVQNSLLSIHL